MNYTLHQLKVFLKVAEKMSITKASEELHLTQPAVSIQLKNFQDQFEIPLIEVIGKQVYVTDFGKEIVDSSKKIIEEVAEIKNKTLAFKGFLTGQLKLSIVSTGKYVMPFFLTDFVHKHRGVSLAMDVTNKATVIKDLETNKIDFALVSVLPENLQVKRIELMENKLYMVRKYNEATKSKLMHTKTMEKTPFIFREKGSATHQAMELFIKSHKIPINKTIQLTSNEAVKQALLADLGYSIMPLIGLKNELNNNQLEIVSVKGLPIKTHWNLVWLKEKRLSPIAEAYLAFLQENKSAIIENHFDWYNRTE
ncbi:MAG: LysR family transcriptional regulator [Reichenbachiella sp.]|uniref:LysR family transcriptional regulator n=1 Tax=Reichenbachiella sp. TaxID=2184521 RepID=UPI00326383D3